MNSTTQHFLFSVLILLLVPNSVRAQQQTDMDAFAAKAATAIHKSKKSSDTKVLVIDFAGMNSKVSAAGSALADQFAGSLRGNTQDFVVVDRADYARATAEDMLSPALRADPPSAHCYCKQLGADFVVQGTIDNTSDTVPVTVLVTRLRDWKTIFSGTVSLPLTPELRAYLSKSASATPLSRLTDKNSWTNPEGSQDQSTVPSSRSSTNGKATNPACISCPNAHFSEAAVKARAQGTIFLSVVVSAAGNPTSIWVVRGLPCGLNSQAMEAVKQWKFKPAEDANGNPTAARVAIEVTLHLY